jgi:myotubularin-related protein 1/2
MNSDSRSKGFSQVVRTCSAITGAVADVLDPLSIFALESAKQAREVVDVKKPNDKGHFLDSTSKRENIGYVSVVNDSAIEKDQKNEKKTDAGLSSEQDEDSIKFLTGEQKIMSLVDASIQTTPGHFMFVTLLMTNYRIAFIPTHKDLRDISAVNPSIHSWLQIPLACIDRLEKEKKSKDLNSSGINVVISCKDFRQHRVTIKSKNSTNGDYDIERAFSVLSAYAFPNNMRYLFAFSHSLAHHGQPVRPVRAYSALSEFSRMGVLDSNLWRQCTANSEYKLCNTYPQLLFAPKSIGDEEMHIVSNFRSGHRLPVLCWADQNSGVTMWRSSQPKAGVSGSCMQDEKLLDLLAKSSLTTRPNATGFSKHPTIREPLLHIVDLRSRASAMANRAAGAGYESQTNYPNTRLEFYNIPNIHGVRDSLRGLAQITLNPSANASNDLTFSKQVDDTMWLTNLRLVLKASWESAAFLSRGYPVLVHCSHGWDRTAQVCAIAQLLLDPFYRTIDGFKILVEKEWIGFGHPFQIRCCHSQDKQTRQEEQVSPIILQFIDAVWQIQRQHCQYFEFNSRYLLTIADHIYSGRFGTFLFSNDYDRVRVE